MIVWTLARANGDTRTLEEWGIRSAVDQRISLSLGSVELGFGRSDLLGSLPFDRDETILIAADGATYFRGRVTAEKRGAFGSNEAASVTLADPWWYLQKLVFARLARVVGDPTLNPNPSDPSVGLQISDFARVSKISSVITSGENENGTLIDSRGMIVDALNYAIAKGAPIAMGTIDDGIQIPREEIFDSTCAEIILKALRWTPDQMGWWDYSVDPPALNIRTRANRAALVFDVADKAIRQVALNPRYDLALPGVTINYLRKHERTNFEFTTIDADTAGPSPLGFGALVFTVELEGSFVTQGPAVGGSTPPAVITPQEEAPVGLALSLYNAFKDVSFEGTISVLAGDPAVLWLSKAPGVVNGAPAWVSAVMNVQQASIDLFALVDADGEYYSVNLTVGPPRHLGPTDLVGLVRKQRTKKTGLLGGSSNGPNAGGAPALPKWNYGNPDVPSANQHPDIILNYYYGQDAGFPNSWGPLDGDNCKIHQTFIGDPVLEVVAASGINDGQIHTVRGIRFIVKRVYVPHVAPGIPGSFTLVSKDAYIDDYFDPMGHRK